ncbi:S-locus receptor kinase (SRK) [Zostera marina]|uniref:S-locus receptor kinase (SRK) n=1 Tax=Zostera marina TaxID=29655 RepID=A0A0K9NRX4_ZOSMR|nr:S-locus receptor kinase (SRK) [Zostera marina]
MNFTLQASDATSYYVLNYTGTLESFEWSPVADQWILTSTSPTKTCDVYGLCGPFGICDYNASSPSICKCFKGFEPKIPKDWRRNIFQGGCVRQKPLSCNSSDLFSVENHMKLPDRVIVYRNITNIGNCRTICLDNCSCTAYSFTPNTSVENLRFIACFLWFDELIDLAMNSSGGLVLYVRLTASKSDHISSGYMSPEYAMKGLFSVKSDVYSFGVLVLEIVSGMRNTSTINLPEEFPNLISYAWQLWDIEKMEEMIDSSDHVSDRPAMSSVARMLENQSSLDIVAKRPTFTVGVDNDNTEVNQLML